MGGNAFKDKTVRLSPAEYFDYSTEVKLTLMSLFSGREIRIVPAYATKPDFGDLDLLMESDNLPPTWMKDIQEAFEVEESFKNGEVFSFLYRNFQTDVILASKSHYSFAFNYLAWNDLGNLIGRVAHKAHLKFGHRGLTYPFRDGNYLIDDILVTQDFNAALRFLGYDAARFQAGFETLEDIFEYATSTPYFNRYAYALENLSHVMRVRDRKRPTYQRFVQWLETNPRLSPPIKRTPEEWLAEAIRVFPDFEERLADAKYKEAQRKIIKHRFNGQIVRDLTGLEDKALGAFIQYLKGQLPDFNGFILANDSATIRFFIQDHYRVWTSTVTLRPRAIIPSNL
jgi:hypothetical protein